MGEEVDGWVGPIFFAMSPSCHPLGGGGVLLLGLGSVKGSEIRWTKVDKNGPFSS